MPTTVSNKALLRSLFINPDAFATSLVVAFLDEYGTEGLTWSPETILMEIEEDFNIQFSQENFDKLSVGIYLLKTDSFYNSLPDFIEICNVLSGAAVSAGVFDPADATECAWGITEALLLSPPDDNEPFTEEIRAYIGKMISMEGIITPPDILQIGLVDLDKAHTLKAEYSDDPILFNAIWDAEASKTEDINSLVKERLNLLVQQLSALSLMNGDTYDIAKKMMSNLVKHTGGAQYQRKTVI